MTEAAGENAYRTLASSSAEAPRIRSSRRLRGKEFIATDKPFCPFSAFAFVSVVFRLIWKLPRVWGPSSRLFSAPSAIAPRTADSPIWFGGADFLYDRRPRVSWDMRGPCRSSAF